MDGFDFDLASNELEGVELDVLTDNFKKTNREIADIVADFYNELHRLGIDKETNRSLVCQMYASMLASAANARMLEAINGLSQGHDSD